MEPVSMLIAAGLILGGYITGRTHRKKPEPDPTICPGCEHSLSFRDPATGQCTEMVKRASRWDNNGMTTGYEWVPCTCTNHASAHQLTIESTWNPPTLPPAGQ